MADECGRYKKYLASIKIPSSTNSGGARSLFLLPCFVKCFGQNYKEMARTDGRRATDDGRPHHDSSSAESSSAINHPLGCRKCGFPSSPGLRKTRAEVVPIDFVNKCATEANARQQTFPLHLACCSLLWLGSDTGWERFRITVKVSDWGGGGEGGLHPAKI